MINIKLHGEARFGEYREKYSIACNKANRMLNDSELWDQIEAKFNYDFADSQGFNLSSDMNSQKVSFQQIRGFFESSDEELLLNTYAPKWCFSNAIAYTLPNNQDNTIYFNKNKFGSSAMNEKFIATIIIHEAVHIIDFSLEDFEFGHGGNSNQGSDEKLRSAPIWIANAFYSLLGNVK